MGSSTCLLIRHGICGPVGNSISGRRPGVHLNELGRRQAEELAHRLAGTRIKAIYSSPLERTIETAEPLAQVLGLTPIPKPAFIEVEFGEWTGCPFSELESQTRWKQFNAYRSATRPPGGELSVDVLSRSLNELLSLGDIHAGEEFAVFSHGDVIRALVMNFLGMPTDLIHRIEISPASISRIELADWGPRVISINETR